MIWRRLAPRGRRAATLLCWQLALGGCATELRMAEIEHAQSSSSAMSAPQTTIRYTAVRAETRQHPDYSSIDRSILTEHEATAAP